MDETHCDTWAHDIPAFDRLVECFGTPKVRICENGAALLTIEVTTCTPNSKMHTYYSLQKDSADF